MEKTASEIAMVKKNVRLQEWERQIEKQKSSGLSVQEWCQQHSIKPNTYYYHLRKVREEFLRSGKSENTQAQRIGQQCYNIKDAKSWTFVGVSSERYIWIEDKQFIYNKGEDKEIDVSIDMTDKIAELSIYDFRWNKIHSVCSDTNSSEISLNVDSELDKIVKPGIYYCTLKIIGEQQSQIKDKFIIIVN